MKSYKPKKINVFLVDYFLTNPMFPLGHEDMDTCVCVCDSVAWFIKILFRSDKTYFLFFYSECLLMAFMDEWECLKKVMKFRFLGIGRLHCNRDKVIKVFSVCFSLLVWE